MQISELAARTGVTLHAIRHYENLGLIAARRRPSGYRAFDDGVVRELRFIVMSRQCGFSLKQIAEVLPAYRHKRLTAAQMITMLEDRIAEIDAEIGKRRALRQHLVSHIDWFRQREGRDQGRKPRAADARPVFPRVTARQPRNAGPAGKNRSKP